MMAECESESEGSHLSGDDSDGGPNNVTHVLVDSQCAFPEPVSRALILSNIVIFAIEIHNFLLPCFLLPWAGVYKETRVSVPRFGYGYK